MDPAGRGPDLILLPNDQLGMAAKEGMIDPVYLSDEEKSKISFLITLLTRYLSIQSQHAIPKSIETLAIFITKNTFQNHLTLLIYIKISKLEKENGRNGFVAKFLGRLILFNANIIILWYLCLGRIK